MKEIISQLIEAEQSAKEIIAKAKDESAKINLDTEKQVALISEHEIEKANQEAKKIVQLAKTASETEKQNVLSELTAEIQASFEEKKSLIPELAKEIIKKITTVTS